VNAVELALFAQRLTSVAREMGELLAATALSTNVKERRDFSCGVLDARGRLLVNAPHIPVHLGALGLCVRRVTAVLPLGPGDVAVTNHPAFGGSHLPDVTVITPVFTATGRRLGYTASRAHHAEIGGLRPGSMPPEARCLAEEGVVIPPRLLVAGGVDRSAEVVELLRAGPYPSRAVEENRADLAAAVAANHRGAAALAALAREHGDEETERGFAALSGLARAHLEEVLRALPRRVYEAAQRLDDGTPIRVRLEHRDGPPGAPVATLSFAGSGGVHPENLNAPRAVTLSAVLYVLRLLLARERPDTADLPLNEGLLEPLVLEVPPGLLDPPFPDDPWRAPAVVGGNVETSQRVVDTLLAALELCAGSQGTMNNVLFGNDRFGYYETVGGGAGAGPGWAGASAVHTHMTNTRITDPELLELRYPVLLERFAVRRGSGGAGRHAGGDGVIREYRFLEPLSLSLLTQRRVEGPYGLHGGHPGRPGVQRLLRAAPGPGEAAVEELPPIAGREVRPGDRLVLETPGGGGWGSPEDDP
jgi:5-oxoprolinase (ATP-hydrolysing)